MDGPAALQCRNLTLKCMQPSRSILMLKEDTSGCQPSFRPQTEVPLEHHAYLLPQPEVAPVLFYHLRLQSEVLFASKTTSDRSRKHFETLIYTSDRSQKYFSSPNPPPIVVGSTSRPLFTLPTVVRSTFHPLIHLRSQSEALFASKTSSDRSRKYFETSIYASDRSWR